MELNTIKQHVQLSSLPSAQQGKDMFPSYPVLEFMASLISMSLGTELHANKSYEPYCMHTHVLIIVVLYVL